MSAASLGDRTVAREFGRGGRGVGLLLGEEAGSTFIGCDLVMSWVFGFVGFTVIFSLEVYAFSMTDAKLESAGCSVSDQTGCEEILLYNSVAHFKAAQKYKHTNR